MDHTWETFEEHCVTIEFTSDVMPTMHGHFHGYAPTGRAAKTAAVLGWLVLLSQTTGLPIPDRFDL